MGPLILSSPSCLCELMFIAYTCYLREPITSASYHLTCLNLLGLPVSIYWAFLRLEFFESVLLRASQIMAREMCGSNPMRSMRQASYRHTLEKLSTKTLKVGKHMDVDLLHVERGKRRLKHDTHGRYEKYRHFDGAASSANYNGETVLLDDNFHLDHCGLISLVLSSDRLVWQKADSEDNLDIGIMCCWGLSGSSCSESDMSNELAISEIYSVEHFEMGDVQEIESNVYLECLKVPSYQAHHFAVHSLQKSSSEKGTWLPKSYVFQHADPFVCKIWKNQLQSLIDKEINRPKNLLVITNPFSGKKTALRVWEEVSPLFNRANVKTRVIKTERIRHAFDIMNKATDSDLAELDGVVVVGGDGLFNEVLNGLLLRRHRAKCPPKAEDFEKPHQGSNCHHKLRSNGTEEEQVSEANKEADLMTQPASGDLHPLLEDMTSQHSCSTKSDRTSIYNLLPVPRNDGNGYFEMNDMTSFAMNKTFSFGFACNHESIQFREGGFISLSSTGGSSHSAEQSSTSGSSSVSEFLFPNKKFRLGIIPAGSTDSIAVSTTGSRNPLTSALHIILGESMPLDIVRLTSWKSTRTAEQEQPRVRYAASFAGYGFYGDVIKESEPNRWMGPLRYDYAGTKVFLQHKLYEAEISYLELPESMAGGFSVPKPSIAEVMLHRKITNGGFLQMICRKNCGICAKGIDLSDLNEMSMSSHSLQKTPRWKCSRGFFISVGAAVISCRNDKAPDGVAVTAHLADGLLHLILVKECSRPAYLWHLIQLTREGSNPLDFNFIEEYRTPQFNFISHGEESIWNVDGELFPAHQLSAQVFRGLINIFASGPDV